jgi:predicted permease
MPAAINSYILAEHFGTDAEFAAAAVSLGTLLSLPVIPVIGHFLL